MCQKKKFQIHLDAFQIASGICEQKRPGFQERVKLQVTLDPSGFSYNLINDTDDIPRLISFWKSMNFTRRGILIIGSCHSIG